MGNTSTSSRRLPEETGSWYQSAADDRRQRLFVRGLVPLFAGGMLVVFWLAQPRAQLAERLAHADRTDQLTLAYLRAWLAAKPNDWPLYLVLARHGQLAGELDEALAVIERAMQSDDPSIVTQAGRMRFSLLRQKIAKLPEGSPEREALMARLVADLEAAARAAGPAELMSIAAEAQALGRPALALKIWRQALAIQPAQSESFYATLASHFLANSEHRLAADAYWRAFDVASTPPRRRALLMQAIRTLQAMNRIGDALDEAEARLGLVQPDRELYEILVRLALAAGRLEQAEKFAREMLRFSLLQQWRAELAAMQGGVPDDLRLVRVAGPGARRPPASPTTQPSAPVIPPVPAGAAPRATERPDEGDSGPQPRLPFDNVAYRLAFDVFLARGNLVDAYKVARSAVRQAPENLEWRRKLAEIAEWTGRPQLALDVWRSITLRVPNDLKAWGEVRRLALALNDQLVMLEVLQWEATRGAPDPAIDLEIAATLERLGEPRQALAWLQRRIDAAGAQADPRLIEALLALTDRMDDPQARIDALRLAMSRGEPQPRLAARLARILMTRGDFRGAFEALVPVAPTAADPARHGADDEKRTLFWLLYAESARLLQREDDAIAGYRERLRRDVHEEVELSRLASLLEPRSLAAALAVLEHIYRTEPNPELLRRIVLIHLRAGNLERVDAILGSADPALRTALEDDGEFLRARGSLLQAAGRTTDARRDFERAVSRRGGDLTAVESLMWLQLAQKDAPALRGMLARFEPATRKDGQLDGVFGAAYLALNEPDTALKHLQRQARRRDDYLWWLAYADGLADAGQAELAWRVRRKVWTEVREKFRDPKAVSPELRTRIVGLAAQFAPSDNALGVLRAALSEANLVGAAAEAAARSETTQRRAVLRRRPAVAPAVPAPAVPANGPELDLVIGHALAKGDPLAAEDTAAAEQQGTTELFRSSVRELGLAWLLSAEAEESARAWLMSRYADELSQPAFARLSLALNARDKGQLVQLLDDMPDWLPKLDRISALKATAQLGAAQELAFDTLGSRPRSDDAHQRFVETLLDDVNSTQFNAGWGRLGPLDLRSQRLGTGLRASPTIGLSLAFERNDYSIQDPSQLAYVPGQDHTLVAGARLSTESAQWRLAVGRRSAIRDFTTARLDWERVFEIGLTVGAAFGLKQTATELPALRVGGHRDLLEARATYGFGPREFIGASLFGSRFHTQDGEQVARGWVLNVDGGYRLRLDYPDVTLKAGFTTSSYSADGQPDAIVTRLAPATVTQPLDLWVPRGSSQVSLGVSVGEAVAQSYTRALRPFGEFGLRSNSVTGAGYNLRGGLSVSIFGSDRLSGYFGIISRTPGNARGTREVGLSYQLYY